MALVDDQEDTPSKTNPKPTASPKEDGNMVSQTSSCQPAQLNNISPPKKNPTPKDFILSVARKFSLQPLQNADPGVWGVLTAISSNARKRSQGINILLSEDENCIGRLVEDTRFRIDSNAVSGKHCKIYRKKIATEDAEHPSSFFSSVFLKDTSTNGTYLNWEKLNKHSAEAQLQNGDIISIAAAPQHELAFAFVYREVVNSTSLVDGSPSNILKRKSEDFASKNKRLKGIGIGASEGPISLDDVRSLQRSNTELRKQLESHAVTIEELRNANRTSVSHHEKEMKDLKESISQSYVNDLKDLRHTVEAKQKELEKASIVSAELQQAIEELNERLNASMQSRTEAGEIINSQKATISEFEKRLDEERKQRMEEREKAVSDLKSALQKAQTEAQEELKRQSDTAYKQERELKEVINKLQESDKESRLLVDSLRTKLEDTRENLVMSEKKVRQLEAQVQEEQQTSLNCRKKMEALECEMKRLRKELENEKVAREEAWAKVSALELEMAAAIRDLATAQQRFQGARERIILRESQLRAFYSTTEEISSLFAKQQEQLKSMQRTLEDEDNYDNTLIDIDLIATEGIRNRAVGRENLTTHIRDNNVKENATSASTARVDRVLVDSTSDEESVTEKHECDTKDQEECQDTQDMECNSADVSVKGGFGSDINGGTAPVPEGDQTDTQQVLGTESPVVNNNFSEQNFDLNKQTTLLGDTMQIDDDTQIQENGEETRKAHNENRSQSNNQPGDLNATVQEDTEAVGTIGTADLLTSEVVGSWAVSTAPSVQGDNESQKSRVRDSVGNDNEAEEDDQAAASQVGSTVVAAVAETKLNQERQALNEMIQIVAPDFSKLFGDDETSGKERDKNEEASTSDSDTEDGTNHDNDANGADEEVGQSISDEDTQAASDHGDDNLVDDVMNEVDDDDSEEDSVG